MSKSIRPRRIIALIAAYVVALQALLLPLSMAAGEPLRDQPVRRRLGRRLARAGGPRQRLPLRRRLRNAMLRADVGRPAASCRSALGVTRAVTMMPAPALAPVVRSADRGPQIPRAPPAV